MTKKIKTRKNIKDIWNAFMVKGADFSKSKFDIPFCPTTVDVDEIPSLIITYSEAKTIYKREYKKR